MFILIVTPEIEWSGWIPLAIFWCQLVGISIDSARLSQGIVALIVTN